jgi:hypothetical protein
MRVLSRGLRSYAALAEETRRKRLFLAQQPQHHVVRFDIFGVPALALFSGVG